MTVVNRSARDNRLHVKDRSLYANESWVGRLDRVFRALDLSTTATVITVVRTKTLNI